MAIVKIGSVPHSVEALLEEEEKFSFLTGRTPKFPKDDSRQKSKVENPADPAVGAPSVSKVVYYRYYKKGPFKVFVQGHIPRERVAEAVKEITVSLTNNAKRVDRVRFMRNLETKKKRPNASSKRRRKKAKHLHVHA